MVRPDSEVGFTEEAPSCPVDSGRWRGDRAPETDVNDGCRSSTAGGGREDDRPVSGVCTERRLLGAPPRGFGGVVVLPQHLTGGNPGPYLSSNITYKCNVTKL